jgi:hypothetical protein
LIRREGNPLKSAPFKQAVVFLLLIAAVIMGTRHGAFAEDADDSEVKTVRWPFSWGDPPSGVPREKRFGVRRRRTTNTSTPVETGVKPVYLTGRESCRKIMAHSQKQAPIYNDFMKWFKRCAGPGCVPNRVYGAWGCRASGRSCHHTGQAVDIGGYKCGNHQVTMSANKNNHGEFDKFVQCMIREGGFRKLYRCKDHYDHAHFSRGCSQRKI